MGFTPLDHDLRTGENTVSWYRGPLAPYEMDANPRVMLPVASPDQATIFDPTTGMFDASYSAAWTVGRLMALQDSAFATALYTWKQGLSQEVVSQVENGILAEAFGSVLQAVQTVSLKAAPSLSADGVHADLQADVQPAAAPRAARSAAGSLLLGAMLSLVPPADR
jgi:hypothetical protein